MSSDTNARERGFTLVELLIVVAILGILAGIVVFAVSNITETAKNTACVQEANTVERVVHIWRAFPGNDPTADPTMAELQNVTIGGTLSGDPKSLMADPPDPEKFAYVTGDVIRGVSCQD